MCRWLFCAVVALASGLAGCGGCDDGPAGADTEFLDEGTGEPNTQPLLPLVVGRRANGLTTDAVIEDGERTLVRMQYSAALVNASTRHADAMLLAQGADGVELVAFDHVRLERPVLLAPTTVRVGMRWRTRSGDRVREYEVMQRYETTTPLGPGIVWVIHEFDETGTQRWAGEFLEGIGLYKTPYAQFDPYVQPLDASADGPVAPALSPTPLVPYALHDDWGENFVPMHVGLVVPNGSTTGTLIAKGWRSCLFGSPDGSGQCLEIACFDATGSAAPLGPTPPRVEEYHRGDKCIQHRLTETNNPTADTGRLETTNDATGALVLPSGVHWVPRNKTGTVSGEDRFPVAVYADPSTQDFRLLAYTGDGLGVVGRHPWAAYLPEDSSFVGLAAPLAGQWVTPETDGHHVPSQTATLGAPGETPELAVVTNQNVLLHSRVDGDTLTPFIGVGTLGGSMSVTSTIDGHAMLVTSPGGRIDRIVRDSSGTLTREAIAQVTPPDGERVVGALDLEQIASGQLLLVTWRPPLADNTDVQGNFGRLAMYTTAKQTAVRWTFPTASAVTASQRVRDAVVCWPPTSEPLDTSGWSIGGAPAKQVISTVDGRCALVVRDVIADPVLQGRSFVDMSTQDNHAIQAALRFDVEGPVPGVGRVRVGVAGASPGQEVLGADGPSPHLGMAPLTGGGYANARRLYGPGGVEIAIPEQATPGDVNFNPGIADRGGAGVWLTSGTELLLVGPTSRRVQLGSTVNAATVKFADPNGGLILATNIATGTWVRVTADGAIETLPQPLTDMIYTARRKTGELCGPLGTDLVCVNGTTGVETSRVSFTDNADIRAHLADDSFLIGTVQSFEYVTQRWVPGSDPVTYRAGSQLTSVTYTLDGTAYCVFDGTAAGGVGGVCAPTAFQPIDLSIVDKTSWLMANIYRDLTQLVAGDGGLWVRRFGCLSQCGNAAIRVPL